MIKSVSVEQ